MSTAIINCPRELTIPPSSVSTDVGVRAGVSDATYSQIQWWSTRRIYVDDVADDRCEIRLDDTYLPLDQVDLWCSLGSEVSDYPCYFKITDPNDPCPFSTEDPPETWNEWGVVGDSHKPIEIDGVWYRSNLEGAAGVPLVASAWYSYITTPADGIEEVLTVADFQAIPRPDPT